MAELRESRGESEAARKASHNLLFEPADVDTGTSQRLVVSEPVAKFPSLQRVPVAPNPVDTPPVQRASLTALRSILQNGGSSLSRKYRITALACPDFGTCRIYGSSDA